MSGSMELSDGMILSMILVPEEIYEGKCRDNFCALMRLAKAAYPDWDAETSDYISKAMRLGIHEDKCYGIMDGWDKATIESNGMFQNLYPRLRSSAKYEEGLELGKKAWEAVKEKIGNG